MPPVPLGPVASTSVNVISGTLAATGRLEREELAMHAHFSARACVVTNEYAGTHAASVRTCWRGADPVITGSVTSKVAARHARQPRSVVSARHAVGVPSEAPQVEGEGGL